MAADFIFAHPLYASDKQTRNIEERSALQGSHDALSSLLRILFHRPDSPDPGLHCICAQFPACRFRCRIHIRLPICCNLVFIPALVQVSHNLEVAGRRHRFRPPRNRGAGMDRTLTQNQVAVRVGCPCITLEKLCTHSYIYLLGISHQPFLL